MLRLVPLVVACAGCDLVFKLNEPPAVLDASVDAPASLMFCPPLRADKDEDDDDVMDADDNCPSDFNPSQADSDGDGIGDFCDPHPSDPDIPDRMCFFGFNDPSELDYLTLVSNDWEVTGGRLRLTRENTLAVVITKQTFTGALMIVRANGLTLATGSTVRLTGAVSGSLFGTAGERGIGCAIEHPVNDGDPPVHLFRLPFQQSPERVMNTVMAAEDFMSIVVRAEGADNKPACLVDHGGPQVELSLSSFAESTGKAAVAVENATVEIGSITIVGRDE